MLFAVDFARRLHPCQPSDRRRQHEAAVRHVQLAPGAVCGTRILFVARAAVKQAANGRFAAFEDLDHVHQIDLGRRLMQAIASARTAGGVENAGIAQRQQHFGKIVPGHSRVDGQIAGEDCVPVRQNRQPGEGAQSVFRRSGYHGVVDAEVVCRRFCLGTVMAVTAGRDPGGRSLRPASVELGDQ